MAMARPRAHGARTAREHRHSAAQLLACCAAVLVLTSRTALGEKNHEREISDRNWEEILQGEWMIEFFAPWCPACQELQPIWAEFAEWGEDMEVNITKVDVTKEPGLSGRFFIVSLPTIYHCKDGVFRLYEGPRTKEDFLSFIDEKKWQDLEPISSWLGPSSFLMNIISGFYRLSMFTRNWHSYLTEHLGMPVWGSYVVFTLAVLFSGLVLGLIVVFITDCVFPSRWSYPPDAYYQQNRARRGDHQLKMLEDTGKQAQHEEDYEGNETEEEDDRGLPELTGEATPGALRKRVLCTGKEEDGDT
ncbi:thioredoxin-related transmembrane protein 1-like isoform X1 [Scleropages formosus]|uniref:Thioredoxin-related transmembrane protein 1 n=1 Tax=Scleropages formosus TaxID=113540 RepID=A0A8C9WQ14_SCLFO|nr:thioredoxin-related transmembrane protein 1-like isoform X1 [Scleropages formosus]